MIKECRGQKSFYCREKEKQHILSDSYKKVYRLSPNKATKNTHPGIWIRGLVGELIGL